MNNEKALSRYVFVTDPERSDRILILQTFGNFNMGQVWLFRTSEEMAIHCEEHEQYVAIEGYRIAVFPYKTLLPAHSGNAGLDNALMKMAELYYNERISKKPNYFKRYKKSE
jgi:hypothetical protein